MTTQRSRGRRFERILGAAALAAVLAYGAIASASLSAQSNDRPLGLAEGDHALALEHDGRSRRYIVRVPRLSRDRPPAVVLALHGGGGSASQFKRDNGLDEVADREGFLAVYHDGTGPLPRRFLTWNAGPHCCGSAVAQTVDDVGFLAAVVDDLAAKIPVDRGRIYAIGHSNGSMMAYRFAAERPDLVTAIVAVAGAMDVVLERQVRDVAVLHIHSIDDPRALYDGGVGPPFPGTDNRVEHQPVMRGLAAWAANNGCASDPRVVDVREGSGAAQRGRRRQPGGGSQTATHLVYDGCRENGVVEHLRLTGVGHGWPGEGVPRLRERLVGPGTTLVQASAEAWAFLSRFAR